jgi:diguanylate cyclase (GGDEF)-like protein/PAS domain S-box-containing protein
MPLKNVDILKLFDSGQFIFFKWINEPNWPVEYVSNNVESIIGRSVEEFTTKQISYKSLIHPDDIGYVIKEVDDASANTSISSFTHRPYRVSVGDDIWRWIYDSTQIIRNEDGEVTHYLGYISDITETKKAMEEVNFFSTHDILTSLPNRVLFIDRVEQAIIRSRRYKQKFAILYLDIDNFKQINNSLGHNIGDKLLQRVSKKLTTALRERDTVSRQGGDEFFILLENIKDQENIKVVIEKLFSLTQYPFDIDNNQLYITYSIGVVLYPENGENVKNLLQHADNAMYQAKDVKNNSYSFFTLELYEKAKEKQEIYNQLHDALQKKEFSLVFQPKVDTYSEKVIGAEALIRWTSSELGFVAPDKFIPLAENTGLIVEIGKWVFQESCTALKHVHTLGHTDTIFSINVSAIEFKQANYVEQCLEIINKVGIEAKYIELELTETVLMDNQKLAISKMRELIDLGFKFAMDDFGTGFSSLSYLKNYPVSTVKIDREFINDLTQDTSSDAIVKVIIYFKEIFGVDIVAEGVETRDQLIFLRQEGCGIIQGYFFSKPLILNDYVDYLEKSL